MGDEMVDVCECIWSREMAMRRLLSLLRQSQSYCTDTECFEELPGPQPSQGTTGTTIMMLAMCWVIFTMVMYFMRPNSLRRRDEGKPRGPGSNGGPPAPPPAALD